MLEEVGRYGRNASASEWMFLVWIRTLPLPVKRLTRPSPDVKPNVPEAISMEISIEFPTEHIEANYADVCVSPTREDENGTEDYDWYDVDIPYDEIEELIKLAEK